MKHYLFTRFCAYWPGNKSYDDPDWLSHRFNLYREYNEPSLAFQKNKNFEQIIVCDERVTDEMVEYFESRPYKTKVAIGDRSCWDLTLENIDMSEKFLLTRYDSDDIIDPNFIDLIQGAANKLNSEDYLIDIPYLNRFSINNNNLYQQRYAGTSMFVTLVSNSLDPSKFLIGHNRVIANYKKIIRVKGLNPYLLIHDKNHYSKEKGKLIKENFNLRNKLWKL